MNILFVMLYLANFIRTVFVILIIYYVLKFVGRLLFPVVVKKVVNNMQEKQSGYQRAQKPEGEVTIETKQHKQHNTNNNVGEYVDFEEIE